MSFDRACSNYNDNDNIKSGIMYCTALIWKSQNDKDRYIAGARRLFACFPGNIKRGRSILQKRKGIEAETEMEESKT